MAKVESSPVPPSGQRFLRKAEVIARTGIPGSTIYEMMERGNFPKAVRISPRLAAWIENEILEWQRARIAERDSASPKSKRTAEARP